MTKYIDKLHALSAQLKNQEIADQVAEICRIDQAVKKRQVLEHAPGKLGLEPDEYEEISWQIPDDQLKNLQTMNNLLNNVRQYLSLEYGIWSLPNLATAKLIMEELGVKTALEVMAGNAYWSKALSAAGMDVVASDSLEWAKTSATGSEPFYPVVNLEAQKAVEKYGDRELILCSWSPNFGDSDIALIAAKRKYAPQAHLLFIGERNGATNSRSFWAGNYCTNSRAISRINQSFVSYDFIEEEVFEVKP